MAPLSQKSWRGMWNVAVGSVYKQLVSILAPCIDSDVPSKLGPIYF